MALMLNKLQSQGEGIQHHERGTQYVSHHWGGPTFVEANRIIEKLLWESQQASQEFI